MALTECSVTKGVVGDLGTTVAERGLTTQQFKDKFDEEPDGIIDYINDTLTTEVDAHIDAANPHSGSAASSHVHGNISNDGKIGSTTDLPVFTTTDGEVTTKTIEQAKTLLGITSTVKIATDTYSGDGSATQDIALAFTPVFAAVTFDTSRNAYCIAGESAIYFYSTGSNTTTNLALSTNKITVGGSGTTSADFNTSAATGRYFAIG